MYNGFTNVNQDFAFIMGDSSISFGTSAARDKAYNKFSPSFPPFWFFSWAHKLQWANFGELEVALLEALEDSDVEDGFNILDPNAISPRQVKELLFVSVSPSYLQH